MFAACYRQPKEEIPEKLIPQEKLREVMSDALIIEAYLSQHSMSMDSLRKVSNQQYEAALKRHGLTRDDFIRSMGYYSRHPEVLDAEFSVVIDSLSVLEARTR